MHCSNPRWKSLSYLLASLVLFVLPAIWLWLRATHLFEYVTAVIAGGFGIVCAGVFGKRFCLYRPRLCVRDATDHDFVQSSNLERAVSLSIDGGSVSERGLSHIQKMLCLEELDICGCVVNDDGIRHLVNLPNLQQLTLSNAGVTDLALSRIRETHGLKTLSIFDCDITDASIPYLATMSGLRCLRLGGVEISDRGLHELREHKALETLWLQDTSVSAAGVEEFRRLRPDVNVFYND